MLRNDIGPIAVLRNVLIIKKLPKTRSGKILRGTLKKLAHNEEFSIPATIDDPDTIEDAREEMKRLEIDKDLIRFEEDINPI
mmetsp:Transcript_11210/g.5674  ORF Transcript_11210/g.5674 Transcript_11210/m.5674 type:complete len:82 (-) Transcript_11210:112-357(-)